MIRRLEETDRHAVLDLLYAHKSLNVYLIADIEHLGFVGRGQRRYGEFVEGKLVGIASQNRRHVTFYQAHDDVNPAWFELIKTWDCYFISGEKRLLMQFKEDFDWHLDDMVYTCSSDFERDDSVDYSLIRELKTDDEARRIYHFLTSIEELYSVHAQTEEEYVQYLMMNTGERGTTAFIEDEGRVVASASAVLESTDHAMIVGVATDPNARRHGYGKTLMHYLMDVYTNKKDKTVCLYYDDPRAEKLYLRYGFKPLTEWVMLVKGIE